jgi:hypothetical protein
VIFTLPAEVAELALGNRTVLYEALFQAASATLRELAADPHWLGAQLGSLLVLHTWGQNLHHHPHVHAVVTGGGLSCNAQGVVDQAPQWRCCRPGFFLPVRVLSRLFRGKYLALLQAAFDRGQLRLSGRWARLAEGTAFAAWLRPLYQQEWVVYAKPPFGGPAQVLKYLARYTHRVAISNQRLLALADGQVTFRYKDYADGQRSKKLTLSAEEFLRRFVQHVLPRGFVKIRHYGLLANRHRAAKLRQCRQLLLPAAVAAGCAAVEATAAAQAMPIEPAMRPCCPHCGGQRWLRRELPGPGSACGDTS